MVHIIIKKGFERHINRAMDKTPIYISSKRQYDYELAKRGLKQYDPDENPQPKRDPYKVKPETREVINAIKSQTDRKGNFEPSGALKKELIQRKVIRKNSEIQKIKERINDAS